VRRRCAPARRRRRHSPHHDVPEPADEHTRAACIVVATRTVAGEVKTGSPRARRRRGLAELYGSPCSTHTRLVSGSEGSSRDQLRTAPEDGEALLRGARPRASTLPQREEPASASDSSALSGARLVYSSCPSRHRQPQPARATSMAAFPHSTRPRTDARSTGPGQRRRATRYLSACETAPPQASSSGSTGAPRPWRPDPSCGTGGKKTSGWPRRPLVRLARPTTAGGVCARTGGTGGDGERTGHSARRGRGL
jgi:hypothetical protein